MFRSSLATFISGSFAGFFASGIHQPLEAALAALMTAGAVALTGYVARRRERRNDYRRHSKRVSQAHRKTRSVVLQAVNKTKKGGEHIK